MTKLMAKRSSPPSAHDVARVAGVSQAAVSRAFTPGASIADATKVKVLRAAKSLGYRPNLIARSLIKGQSGIIGVVIGNPRSPFFMAALDMLLSHLARRGKHCLVFTTEADSSADAYVDDLLKFRVDGLVLMAATVSSKYVEQCSSERIPLVFLGRRPRYSKDFVSVAGNNQEGGRQIAEHLIRQGYRKLAFMAGREESSTSREREEGFTSYLKAEGLPAPERDIGNFQRDSAMEAARRLLSRKSRPDAIACANDYMAIGALEVARYEFGLKIGPEVGIAGFDAIELASWPSFDLTTFSYPLQTMIETVGSVVLAPPSEGHPGHKSIEGVLKARSSTRRDAS